MKIVVTGAAGFIGSHIVDAYLADGHEVMAMDDFSSGSYRHRHPRCHLVECDLRDRFPVYRLLQEWGPDIVNHHAAQADVMASLQQPEESRTRNVDATAVLIDASLRYGVRKFIFASSGGAVYGNPPSLPASEDSPCHPISPYGQHKLRAEQLLSASGLPHVILRYGNVYGPRQRRGIFPTFANLLFRNQPPVVYGDGSKTRDYLHIVDVVRANQLALGDPLGCFNIGSGLATTDLAAFNTLAAAMSSDLQPRFAPLRPGEVNNIWLDISWARYSLNWHPSIPLDEGIHRILGATVR